MKTKYTLLIFSLFLSFTSFAQLETFDGFTQHLWTSTPEIEILNFGEIHPTNFNASGAVPFTATSPSFSLLAGETYLYDVQSIHYYTWIGSGTNFGYTGFSSIVLIDATDTVVVDLTSSIVVVNASGLEQATGTIVAPTSGVYRLQLTGQLEVAEDFINPIVSFEEFTIFHASIERTSFNIINGQVSYDQNSDACATTTNFPSRIRLKTVEAISGNTYYTNSQSNGNYSCVLLETNANFVTTIDNPALQSSPTMLTNVLSSGQVSNNQDFCFTNTVVGDNVNVIVMPIGQARPGFNSSYRVYYQNLGNTVTNGSVSLAFDNSKLSHLSSSPSENTNTASSLTWNYTNLQPFESRYINVFFNIFIPPTVNNGDVLSFTGNITPLTTDVDMADNSFTLNQIAVGSYDPNDSTILEGPLLTATQAQDFLHIRLRFQNTGTASAININVETELDSYLDWSTFQPLFSSHAYTSYITNSNQVRFNFPNINLPDSTSDEPNSHGFVVFKIKPISTFAIGDLAENQASIYFDYNLPIITNVATTQIDNSLDTQNFIYQNEISIYPNPTNEYVFIKGLKQKEKIKIYSMDGKLVLSEYIFNESIDVAAFLSGIYLVQLESKTLKFVKQ